MVKKSNLSSYSKTSDPARSYKKRKLEEEEEEDSPSLDEGLSDGSGEGDLLEDDEDDSDMDPEKPHAVAWEDDEELDEDLPSGSEEADSASGSDDDDDDARLNRLQRGMASLPFGTLLQAKKEAEPSSDDEEDINSESYRDSDDEPPEVEEAKPTDWKIAADRKAVPKRVTKTAPAVETSKKPVSRFRHVVEVKKMEARDPRFSSLAGGEFDATKFASSYGFITDIQKDEAKKIRHTIRDIKKTLPNALPNTRQQEIRRIDELKKALNRTETSIKKARREAREREVLMQARKEEKEKRSEGKGEWYLKDSEKRKLLLQTRFADMEAEGGQRKVKKFLEKKEKEIAQKEKKARPYAKGEFYRDGRDAPKPCTGAAGDKFYDLSALTRKKDYVITSSSGTKFTLNVCGAVHSELWNPKDVKVDTVGGFFRGEHGDISIGAYATNITVVNDEPYLYMKDGSLCPGSKDLRASTAIRFICDAGVFSEGVPKLIAQLPPGGDSSSCAFFIEWRTPVACATKMTTGTAGILGVFFSLIFIAFLVYAVGIFAYNRYVLGLRGADQLPSFSFMSLSSVTSCFHGFVDTVQDRFDELRSRPRYGGGGQFGSWGRGRRASAYGRPPEEAQGIAEPRFSLEDEEDDGPILYNDIDRQKNLPPVPPASQFPAPTSNGANGGRGPAPTANQQGPPPKGMDEDSVIRLS
ncbi:hypothetical protein FRB90_002911 [Tulasnella sp. 427]|nr:hypothetical protein FRB90_002911 [Tulasnella sp. 427]